MSTEQPKSPKFTVLIDRSPEVEAIRKELEAEKAKNAKAEETIKGFLAKDAETERKAAEYVNSPKPAPKGDPSETAPLQEPDRHATTCKLDEESELLSMNPSFPNAQAAIDYIKLQASNPRSGDYQLAQKMYGQMVKRALKDCGVFEFKGNMARWERRGNTVVKASRPQVFEKVEGET
jgi:hypothetical protein